MDVADLYLNEPKSEVKGIPVFSDVDFYIENYQDIAKDHVAKMTAESANPFIGEELWRTMEKSTRDLLAAHVPSGARILDVGVGLGRLLGPMDQYRRHGIDISLDYLERAKAQGIDVAFARIEDMPFQDGVFDAVVTCDVLEHVLDLDACIRQILRVLKPGGTLVVRVPFREDLEAYLDENLPYEYVHLRNFDVASLRLLFGKIHKLKYIEHTLVAPVLQGAPRLKHRLLEAGSPLREILKEVERSKPSLFGFRKGEYDESHPLHLLKMSTLVDEEAFVNWIYALEKNDPEWFKRIAEYVVHPMEVNMVFTK